MFSDMWRIFMCNRVESARQSHEDQSTRQHSASNSSTTGHEHLIRRNHSEVSERENDISYRARPRPRTHHYAMERPPEQEVSRPRPRSFYENPTVGRDFRDQRNVADPREVRVIDSTPSSSTVPRVSCHEKILKLVIVISSSEILWNYFHNMFCICFVYIIYEKHRGLT